METYKLIQSKTCKGIFHVLLIVLAFYACQPLANSLAGTHEDMESEFGEYVKHKGGYVMALKTKEPFEIRNGRIIYLEHCAPCHGTTGKGDGSYYASGLKPKPRNFTDSGFAEQVQDDYLLDVIWKGTAAFGKSPYCPPWGGTLKEKEKARNIISFLRTLAVHDNPVKGKHAE